MQDLAEGILGLFAAFGATFELGENVIVAIPSDLRDPHPAADEFLAASPTERARIRARYDRELEERRAQAKRNRTEAPQTRRRPGEALTAAQERAIRDLAQGGLSAREIERRTGVGRATVARRLAGVKLQQRGRKKAAS